MESPGQSCKQGAGIAIASLIMMFASGGPSTAGVTSQLGISFMLELPQGEFRDHISENGYAANVEVLVSPASMNFAFGGSIGIGNYGSETRREPINMNIPDVMVDVNTNNNIMLGHFLIRMQRKVGAFRPYLDGMVGLSYLYTETSIHGNTGNENDEIASSTNFDDVVFSYGGGPGIMIDIYTPPEDNEFKMKSLLLDARIRYVAGGLGEYLKPGSIRRENGQVFYDATRSHTDVLTFQVGVVLEF